MYTGYNHNVRYRGLLFHVQTEDGGERNPVITTHVFFQGNVVTSRKISYRHIQFDEAGKEQIKKMMQEQHKAVIKALVKGELDALEGMKGVIPQEEKDQRPIKSSVYKIFNPEQEKLKDGEKSEKGTEEKSLDEMILDYLNGKKET